MEQSDQTFDSATEIVDAFNHPNPGRLEATNKVVTAIVTLILFADSLQEPTELEDD